MKIDVREKIVLFQEKIKLCKNDKRRMKLLYNISTLYLNERQYFLCEEWSQKLLKEAEKCEDSQETASANFLIGKCYYFLDMPDLALEYLWKALNCYTMLKDRKNISLAMVSIGATYTNMRNYDEAIKWYQNSIEYDTNNISSLINLSILYDNKKEYEAATQYSLKAIETAELLDNQKYITLSKLEFAYSYLRKKEYKKSLELFQQVLDDKTIYNSFSCPALFIYISMSSIYFHLGNSQESMLYLSKAEKSIENIKEKYVLYSAYMSLSEYYEEMNDKDNALKYLQKCLILNNEVFTDKLAGNLAQIREKYEREKKELELSYQEKLETKDRELKERIEKIQSFYYDIAGLNNIAFFSDEMVSIYQLCDKFHEDRNIPVLIEGETGTGKEIIARLIHFGKNKSAAPLISINCSAISPSLFESELFGYEGGAFTGAKSKGMSGKLELAQGGTLFLDEIGDMPLVMQPKLLRVLQEKEIYRIGSAKNIKLDVRIICATNQNISSLINEGKFRKDLYYRLNTGHIRIPPLRERKEEIIPLTMMFLKRFSEQKNKMFKSIDKEAIEYLENQDWNGNVRELENCIERAVVLFNETELKKNHLINHYAYNDCVQQTANNILISISDKKKPLPEIEKEIIAQLLKKFNGNQTKTAEFLDITTRTIRNKFKQ